jgi:hypothetical protein
MPRRPFALKLMIAFLCLAPIGMIAVLVYYDRTFYRDLPWLVNLQIGLFCVSSLLAAFGIYRARALGFWTFLLFILGCAVVDLNDFVSHPEDRNIGYLLDLIFASIGLLIIFHKRYRQLFFDKAMRWWERSTRFNVDWPVQAQVADQTPVVGTLQSISYSGCFIASTAQIALGTRFPITFGLNGQNQTFQVEAVRASHNPAGVGCTFIHSNARAESDLKSALKKMSKQTAAVPSRA